MNEIMIDSILCVLQTKPITKYVRIYTTIYTTVDYCPDYPIETIRQKVFNHIPHKFVVRLHLSFSGSW